MLKNRRLFTVLATLVLAVAFAAPAVAQNPTEDTYSGTVGQVDDNTAKSSPSAQAPSQGSLPFTGFESAFIALAGLGLLGAGAAARRASSPTD